MPAEKYTIEEVFEAMVMHDWHPEYTKKVCSGQQIANYLNIHETTAGRKLKKLYEMKVLEHGKDTFMLGGRKIGLQGYFIPDYIKDTSIPLMSVEGGNSLILLVFQRKYKETVDRLEKQFGGEV